MLRAIMNECEMSLTVRAESPILVKDGRYRKPDCVNGDRRAPDSFFQCADPIQTVYRNVQNYVDTGNTGGLASLRYFIPGSSLRGAFRSHIESIIRSYSPENPIVCNPLVDHDESRGGQAGSTEPGCSWTSQDYASSCPVCRLFGSTNHGGRISFTDAQKVGNPGIQFTERIAIDRFTGSVRSGLGPFTDMLLYPTSFKFTIVIRNFELWQLGLLAYTLKDLGAKRFQLGAGRNLDRGRISCNFTLPTELTARIRYFGRAAEQAGQNLAGLYELFSDAANHYQFVPANDRLGIPGVLGPAVQQGLFTELPVSASSAFLAGVAARWNLARLSPIFPGRYVAAGGDQ